MKKLLLACLVVALIGCGAKKPPKDTMTEQDMNATQNETIERDKPKTSPDEIEGIPGEDINKADMSDNDRQRSRNWDDAFADTTPDSDKRDIYFEYDSYEIKSDSESLLESLVVWLNNNKDVKITVEGHCDNRGANEYNLALGERRAMAVKNYLVFSGISADRVTVLSYGEERPACRDNSESCYRKNRRAHLDLPQ
jgi:peptidoglycan-associated lipoprotein